MANWFYLNDGHPVGPIGSPALKQLATSGRLKPSDKVRREDMAEWYEAKQVKGLFAAGQFTESSSEAATATVTPDGAPHADDSSHNSTESTGSATARATSLNGKSNKGSSTEKALSTASEITKQVWAGMRWAATLASKQAALKAIQLSELFKADRATGKKAYANSIGRQQFSDLYHQLEELDREIEKTQAAETVDPSETVVDRTKRIARTSKKRVDVEIRLQKRSRLLSELGRSLRESAIVDSEETLTSEIACAGEVAARAAALEQEISKLSACQPKWLRRRRLIMIASVAGVLLAATWVLSRLSSRSADKALMAVMAEQLKVAELRDDSTTASSPRLAGALVLTDFAKTSSNRYSELGFGDFHFGMSPEEVTRHPSVKGPLVTGDELGGFVRDLAKHCFYFDKNQLRAIGKDYEGDMTGYFDELSRLFGKPERDGVFTVVGRDSINKTSHARVDVYYFFPHTISCISAMAGKSRSGVQYLNEPYRTTTSSFELVTVRIVDKDWLLPQAEAYANNLGAILIWINENAAPIQLQKVSTLPDFPKAKRTFSPLGEANVHKSNTRGGLSEVVYYDAEGNTFLSVEHFDYKGERASGMPESGSVKIDLDSAKLPSGQHEIVSCGVLQHLRCRLNTRVVQSVFPSNDGKVYQGQSQNGFEFYKWTDKYDITIEVSTNMITLRHGRAKL